MIRIDAIVRTEKMEEVEDALKEMHVHGMTISEVMGCGTSLGYTTHVRASKVDVNLVPKVKFEVVVSNQEWADKTVEAISKVAYTGEHGDGKIFLYELLDTVRIRTGEHGPKALWDLEQFKEGQED